MNFTEEDKVIEVAKYYTWMGKDGIVRSVVKKNAEVSLADAKENTAAVETFYYGKKYPLLIDARSVKSVSKEARDHFSLRGRDSVVNSFAIIISSPLSRIIGNFFMGLNKPTVPMRLFDNEKDAIKWLKKFL
ncbi:MAG TPA: STAS/SEC14 domain-containing protein [Flavobacteriales bacterium]|nr:STAS/SEC14 domain-containing protein [Flavobacteriales bacterium]